MNPIKQLIFIALGFILILHILEGSSLFPIANSTPTKNTTTINSNSTSATISIASDDHEFEMDEFSFFTKLKRTSKLCSFNKKKVGYKNRVSKL